MPSPLYSTPVAHRAATSTTCSCRRSQACRTVTVQFSTTGASYKCPPPTTCKWLQLQGCHLLFPTACMQLSLRPCTLLCILSLTQYSPLHSQ